MEVGGEGDYILSLHCHHQNDSCFKMGSDESHFNVSVGSDGQSHNCPRTTIFLKRKESWSGIESRSFRYQPNALIPFGLTGSHQCACSGPWRFNLFPSFLCRPFSFWLAESFHGPKWARHVQSSGAVSKSRWPTWAFRPNEPYGFCGRKATLNHA